MSAGGSPLDAVMTLRMPPRPRQRVWTTSQVGVISDWRSSRMRLVTAS